MGRRFGLGVAGACALAVAAVGLGVLGIEAAAFASDASDPWGTAAAKVTFPLYAPTVTLGYKLEKVEAERCGYGNTWVNAAYTKGAGKRTPAFYLTEAYPQFCGDTGESQTVGSIDVNGAKVPVAVYCYGGTGCAVRD